MMPKAGGQYVYLREAVLAALGLPLRLDAVPGDPDRHHRRRGRGLRPLPRACSCPAISPTTWIMPPDRPLGRATRSASRSQQLVGHPADRLPDLAQHPRHPARQADPEHLHLGQDAVAPRPDRPRHPGRPQRRRPSPPTSATSGRPTTSPTITPDFAHRRADRGHGRRLRAVRRLLRRPGGLAVLLGRLEQHHLHRRRGEEPEAEHAAVARRRHRPGDHASTSWPTSPTCAPCRCTQIQTAPDDRVATAALQAIFGPAGAAIMAVAIIISTFGCNNGLILAGARVYYAMAQRRPVLPHDRPAERAPRAGLRPRPPGRLGLAAGAAPHRARVERRTGAVDLRQPLRQPARLRGLRGADLLRADHRRACSCCGASGRTRSGRTGPSAIRWSRRSTSWRRPRSPLVLLLYKTATSLAGAGHRADRHPRLLRSGAADRLSLPPEGIEDIGLDFRLEV